MRSLADGSPADLSAIAKIYEHYVRSSAHTFDIEPPPASWWQEWLAMFGGDRYRLLVAREAGAVVGYAYTSPYRDRGAYSTSVCMSVYVAPNCVGRGLGTDLYVVLIASLNETGIHRAYAAIALPNSPSISLHERFGFVKAAHFSEQGWKFGRYWDVAWYERPC
jgi:phosphinothricin acetyltransferase